jgi:hypothetical protein
MSSEMNDWRTAVDFLPIGVVVDHAFRRANEAGQTPYSEYAFVQLDASHVLCAQRGDNLLSVEFMSMEKAQNFRRQFMRTFLHAFAA